MFRQFIINVYYNESTVERANKSHQYRKPTCTREDKKRIRLSNISPNNQAVVILTKIQAVRQLVACVNIFLLNDHKQTWWTTRNILLLSLATNMMHFCSLSNISNMFCLPFQIDMTIFPSHFYAKWILSLVLLNTNNINMITHSGVWHWI